MEERKKERNRRLISVFCSVDYYAGIMEEFSFHSFIHQEAAVAAVAASYGTMMHERERKRGMEAAKKKGRKTIMKGTDRQLQGE